MSVFYTEPRRRQDGYLTASLDGLSYLLACHLQLFGDCAFSLSGRTKSNAFRAEHESSTKSLLQLLLVPNIGDCVRTILLCFYKLRNLGTLNLCHVTSKLCTVTTLEYLIEKQN